MALDLFVHILGILVSESSASMSVQWTGVSFVIIKSTLLPVTLDNPHQNCFCGLSRVTGEIGHKCYFLRIVVGQINQNSRSMFSTQLHPWQLSKLLFVCEALEKASE